jgi:hypothetical protein
VPPTNYNTTTLNGQQLGGGGPLTTIAVHVRVKKGWLGQVVVYQGGEVLWESKPKKTREKAQAAAEKAHLQGVRDLFSYLPGQI